MPETAPRPDRVGGPLMLAGGLCMLLAPVTGWYRLRGSTVGAFARDALHRSNAGWGAVLFGAVVTALGVILLVVSRAVVAAAAGVGVAAVAVFWSLTVLTELSDRGKSRDFHSLPGPWLVLAGAALALAGAVAALVHRDPRVPPE